MNPKQLLTSLDRVPPFVALTFATGRDGNPLGLNELADAIGFSRKTAYRIMRYTSWGEMPLKMIIKVLAGTNLTAQRLGHIRHSLESGRSGFVFLPKAKGVRAKHISRITQVARSLIAQKGSAGERQTRKPSA